MSEFVTDGCTGIPFPVWFESCCVQHDFAHFDGVSNAIADSDFMQCVVESSQFLGPWAFVFGGIVVTMMAVFRPMYRLYQRLTKK